MELLGIVTTIGFLLFISAMVSGSETALFSLKPHDLERMGRQRSAVSNLLMSPRRLLTIILLSNLFVNTLCASLMQSLAARFVPHFSVPVSLVVGTIAVLVFGEVTPKIVAMRHNVGFAQIAAPFVRFLGLAFFPLVEALVSLTRFFARRFGSGEGEAVTEEDIKALVSHSEDIGALDRSEERWIHSIFELDKRKAGQLMTPKDKIYAFPREIDFETATREIVPSGYSRVPLYAGTIDQIVGILYTRDLLIARARGKAVAPARLARKPLYVPKSMNGDTLLAHLRASKMHAAVVVDEFGNTAGLIALEDILELIVGEIRDRRREGRSS